MVSGGAGDRPEGKKRAREAEGVPDGSEKKRIGRPRNAPRPPARGTPVKIEPKPSPPSCSPKQKRDKAQEVPPRAPPRRGAPADPGNIRPEVLFSGHDPPDTLPAVPQAPEAQARESLSHDLAATTVMYPIFPTGALPAQSAAVHTQSSGRGNFGRDRGVLPLNPHQPGPSDWFGEITVICVLGNVTLSDVLFNKDYGANFICPHVSNILGLTPLLLDRPQTRVTPRGTLRVTHEVVITFLVNGLDDIERAPYQCRLFLLPEDHPDPGVPIILTWQLPVLHPDLEVLGPYWPQGFQVSNVFSPSFSPSLGFPQSEQHLTIIPDQTGDPDPVLSHYVFAGAVYTPPGHPAPAIAGIDFSQDTMAEIELGSYQDFGLLFDPSQSLQ